MNTLTAVANVSAPCPVGWCAFRPLGDLPTFVKCFPPGYSCPGVIVGTPVPTMSEWAQILTVVLLACVALRRLGR